MRLAIGLVLLILGFIFGVIYDQNVVVLSLHKELKAERERNTILKDATERMRENKFKIGDYIYDAMKRFERKT